jgi:hypothetical protein
MKKALLMIAVATLIAVPVVAEVYLVEDFASGVFPPAGWTIEYYNGWTNPATNYAGGMAPEAYFAGAGDTGHNTALVSPVLDISGAQDLTLRFQHMVDMQGGGAANFLLQVRSAANAWPYSGGPWTNYTAVDVPAQEVVFEFAGTNYQDLIGIWDFQFRFLIGAANIQSVAAWYIDEVVVYSGDIVATESATWSTIKYLFD